MRFQVFPFDYKGSEFTSLSDFTIGTFVIDIAAYFGWVYDRKVATPSMIVKRAERTGDGSHWSSKKEENNNNIFDQTNFENLNGNGKIKNSMITVTNLNIY